MNDKEWFVYVVRCSDNTLYTGITVDIEARIKKHNEGTASKYTSGRTPVVLKYLECCKDRSEALRKEYRLKSLSRKQKLEIISSMTVGQLLEELKGYSFSSSIISKNVSGKQADLCLTVEGVSITVPSNSCSLSVKDFFNFLRKRKSNSEIKLEEKYKLLSTCQKSNIVELLWRSK